ncbi:family 1 glycosylhydrolase [Demequina capsici]|uniref:Family 1 glycosylhydrolase n=1 Tax=Demequina capsici TaxID=3075620 RepID=A0AA96JA56_9MICO|nr:family 1 glycosylhydrolase [Demequina sp. PMTSA13]WNM26608.1 family 1 glycosylhydrolase [Demequina sp. PMTSA13]
MASVSMPTDFLWGVAVAGHQIDGGDTTSDTSFLENVEPTVFVEPSGAACGSWERWPEDLDLAAGLGLNAYRFSVEWCRIEPDRGVIDESALDHYEAIIDGCLDRGLAPVVTFSHFTAPHWFACRGSWLAPEAAADFARFCDLVMERLGDRIAIAVTLNEPNLQRQLAGGFLPPQAWEGHAVTLDAASKAAGVERYRAGNVQRLDELELFEDAFERAHVAAREAIKARRPDLPVGLSLAVADEFALPGGEAARDKVREECYGRWLRLAEDDDFVGVQNYERILYGPEGRVATHPGQQEVEPLSLAGAVSYCHEVSGVPVLVSEHGMNTEDDEARCAFLTAALAGLDRAIADGVPVLGYCHWSLLDNYEWIFAFGPKFGLHAVDRVTLDRSAKRSAAVFAAEVARRSSQVARR